MSDYIPTDPERERWILGACIAWPEDHFGTAAEILTEVDFSLLLYREIFAGLQRLDEQNARIDEQALNEVLKGNKELENAGGIAFLSLLGDKRQIHRAAPVKGLVPRITRTDKTARPHLGSSANGRESHGKTARRAGRFGGNRADRGSSRRPSGRHIPDSRCEKH